MKSGNNRIIVISILILSQILSSNLIICNASAPQATPPSIKQLAENSDLIFTGKVTNITTDENYTNYDFQVYEYLKNSLNSTTFTYKSAKIGRISYDVTFILNEEYLLFLVKDTNYHIAYGPYGKMKLSDISAETINNLRYFYDPKNTIIFQDLRIAPDEIHKGKNITIRFNITNKQEKEAIVGFIIEHHPPPYQIIDQENMTLKYVQYAKSVTIPAKRTITYEYILNSNYTGVNTVMINYQGGPKLTDTFLVTRFSNFMGNPETVTFETNSIVYYLPLFLIVGIFTLGVLLRTIYPKPLD